MSFIDFGIIAAYLLLTVGIGIYYGRGVNTLKDFAVGSGNVTIVVMVATIAATTNGGNAFLGQSEQLYASGLLFILIMIAYPINGLLIGKYIVPRVSPFEGALSVGDLMKQKFGILGQVTSGIFAFIKTTGTVAGQVTALSIFMNSFIGIPVLVSVIASSATVVAYSAYGGVRSVATTDAIQFCIMMVGIPVLTALSMKAAGGNEIVFDKIISKDFLLDKESSFYYISLFFIFALPIFPPALVQRLFMMKDLKKLATSFKISAYADIPMSLIVIFMVGSFMVLNPEGVSPNNIVPYLIENILPVGMRGLVIAALMAAIMSTADSNVNAASVAFTNDILKPLSKKNYTEKQELIFARLASVAVGVFAILAALYFKSIFDIALAFLNVWIPVMVVPLYAVIFNHQGDQHSFIRSSLGGITSWFAWKYYGQDVLPLHPIIVSLSCSFLCFHWPKVKSFSWFFSLLSFCQKKKGKKVEPSKSKVLLSWIGERADHCHSDIGLFGLFAGFGYILSVFLLSLEYATPLIVGLQTAGALLCFVVIFKGFLPDTLQQKFSYLWFLILSYALTFVPTLLLLQSPSSEIIIVVVTTYFLLSVIVDWAFFLTVLFFGALSASLFSLLFNGLGFENQFINHPDGFRILFLSLLCVSIVGALFSRKREKIEHEKRLAARAIAGEMAHELRTPLQVILMRVQHMDCQIHDLLLDPSKSQNKLESSLREKLLDIKKSPDVIVNNLKHSFKMIDMVLKNLKKISLKEGSSINFRSFVQEVLEAYPYSSKTQKELVQVDYKSLEGLVIYGDSDLLRNVLDNLMKNALRAIAKKDQVKHSIKIWGFKEGERIRQDCKINICFQDSGVGIDPGSLLSIFEPFYSSEQFGTGIGLSFCKNVMRAHGGEIYCHSEVENFTKFTLEFPDHQL